MLSCNVDHMSMFLCTVGIDFDCGNDCVRRCFLVLFSYIYSCVFSSWIVGLRLLSCLLKLAVFCRVGWCETC